MLLCLSFCKCSCVSVCRNNLVCMWMTTAIKLPWLDTKYCGLLHSAFKSFFKMFYQCYNLKILRYSNVTLKRKTFQHRTYFLYEFLCFFYRIGFKLNVIWQRAFICLFVWTPLFFIFFVLEGPQSRCSKGNT